jgi:hypothetical protein
MALVAWAPTGYNVPMEMLVAKLPPGKVTERQWWEALSDRISEMAVKAGDEAVTRACQALDLPGPENLQETGQFLVMHNLNLMTHLQLLQYKNPFPATVGEPTPEMKDALKTTLDEWVQMVEPLVSK